MNSKRAYQVLSAIHGLREVDGELPDDVEKNLTALESSLKSNLPGEKSSSDAPADKPDSDSESPSEDKAKTFEEAGEKTRKRMKGQE